MPEWEGSWIAAGDRLAGKFWSQFCRSGNMKGARFARSVRSANLEEPLVHDAARPGVVQLKIAVRRYLQGGSFRSPLSTIISILVSLLRRKVGRAWSNWSA
jgi:hypothetical protein